MVDSVIHLRRTELSRYLHQECIVQDICTSDRLSYGQIVRMMIVCLAFGKLPEELCEKIVGSIPSDVSWKSFIEILCCMKHRECREDFGNVYPKCAEESMEVTFLQKFCEALQDTDSANWKKKDENWMKIDDCLSPGCFLYLVERFLILVSQHRGIFFTIKSSFVEWLISEQFEARPTSRNAIATPLLENFYDSVLVMVQELLYDNVGTVEWIARSKVNVNLYYKKMVLRLVFVLCLLCVNCEKYYDVLFNVLSIDDVRYQLPEELCVILKRGIESNNIQINDFVEAFQSGGDTLMVVSLGEMIVTGVEYSNVVSVQLGENCLREDILCSLLPARTDSSIDQSVTIPEVMSCVNFSSHCGNQPKISAANPVFYQHVQMNWSVFQEMSDVLKSTRQSIFCKCIDLSANVDFLTAAINLCSEKKLHVDADMMEEARNMLQELIQLHSLMTTSNCGKDKH
ncbi:hypothetical protein P3L10_014187 [Capsicum annuum]